ncbi:Protein-tyrosine phosphatase-like, PTPLA [Dillenia turbinata]|uniref:Very-long-chain (3R)-3-hydroxyacyl-CoA dehydratase n=1 Tax=Dillenia turbinata TaxID=194707 RepID=A0AAN8V594_9MAGN
MASLSNLYLLVYNSLQAFGWALSLLRILAHLATTKSINAAYASSGDLICLLQTISFLEVIHGAIGKYFSQILSNVADRQWCKIEIVIASNCVIEGIVPSGVLVPLMQWGGRTHFLLAIVRQIVEVQELPAVFVTFVAWSLSDIIRYLHYAFNCVGSSPHWITYVRYTAFIVLYPVGLGPGEMRIMYEALPYIKAKRLYEDFFLGLHTGYYNFVKVCPANMLPISMVETLSAFIQATEVKTGEAAGKEEKMTLSEGLAINNYGFIYLFFLLHLCSFSSSLFAGSTLGLSDKLLKISGLGKMQRCHYK